MSKIILLQTSACQFSIMIDYELHKLLIVFLQNILNYFSFMTLFTLLLSIIPILPLYPIPSGRQVLHVIRIHLNTQTYFLWITIDRLSFLLYVHNCMIYLFRPSNDTHIFCRTQPSDYVVEVPVFLYDDDTRALVNFTYKPNPNITAINRVEVFIRWVSLIQYVILYHYYIIYYIIICYMFILWDVMLLGYIEMI